MVPQLPAALKDYTFPVPGEPTSMSSSSTTVTKMNGDTDIMMSSVSDVSNMTTSTTVSTKSTTSDVSKLLPSPPTHEPGKENDKPAKKEKSKNKYKRILKEKLKIGKSS